MAIAVAELIARVTADTSAFDAGMKRASDTVKRMAMARHRLQLTKPEIVDRVEVEIGCPCGNVIDRVMDVEDWYDVHCDDCRKDYRVRLRLDVEEAP